MDKNLLLRAVSPQHCAGERELVFGLTGHDGIVPARGPVCQGRVFGIFRRLWEGLRVREMSLSLRRPLISSVLEYVVVHGLLIYLHQRVRLDFQGLAEIVSRLMLRIEAVFGKWCDFAINDHIKKDVPHP
jgi:hypothetical protein